MSTPAKVRITKATSLLTVLVNAPGGMPRGLAIAEASRRVETQRAPALQAIHVLIDCLEELTPKRSVMLGNRLSDICRITDQLISLAVRFDLAPLAEAGKRLSDLASACAKSGKIEPAAIAVHVQSLRLLMATDTCSQEVLGELDRVLTYLGIARPDPC